MKSLLAVLLTVVLAGAIGCGGEDDPKSQAPDRSTAEAGVSTDTRDPADPSTGGNGSATAELYGGAASPAVTEAVTAIVVEFSAAMAASDAEKACSYLSQKHRSMLTQGKDSISCADRVLTLRRAFPKKHHKDLARTEVTGVRVDNSQVLAFYAVPGVPKTLPFPVRFEDGRWKIAVFGERTSAAALGQSGSL